MEEDIETKMQVYQTTYSLLYMFYAFPNMFIPLISGIVMKKIGLN